MILDTVHDLKCSLCDHPLLATPTGWVCSHCDDKIPYQDGEIPKKMDIIDTVTDCCTGTTPCPPKYEVTIPCAGIRNGRDGRYCDACGAKLNKHTPRRCPQCDWDLWTRATEKRL